MLEKSIVHNAYALDKEILRLLNEGRRMQDLLVVFIQKDNGFGNLQPGWFIYYTTLEGK